MNTNSPHFATHPTPSGNPARVAGGLALLAPMKKGGIASATLWFNASADHTSGVSDFALRRWRRFISPFTAVTINCAFVSPFSRLLSSSATTSCGKRALSCCDLLLVEPVAITASPRFKCDSVYAKKMTKKGLRCDSPSSNFKSGGAIHLINAKPGSAATLTGPLTNNAKEPNIMAKPECTQTHPEFTSRSSLNAGPMLFTFCIAPRLARLAALRRIRTVSTVVVVN